jgi:hypothetical protein
MRTIVNRSFYTFSLLFAFGKKSVHLIWKNGAVAA